MAYNSAPLHGPLTEDWLMPGFFEILFKIRGRGDFGISPKFDQNKGPWAEICPLFTPSGANPLAPRLWLCWPQSGAMAKSNSAGKKPMGSGMQQTTLVARRSVVSPSNGSPKSDQLGLGGKKNGKKKKAPTHKKMCLTPRPGNPKTGCSNQPAPAHAAMHLCAALPQTRTRSSSRSQARRLPASFDAHPHTR